MHTSQVMVPFRKLACLLKIKPIWQPHLQHDLKAVVCQNHSTCRSSGYSIHSFCHLAMPNCFVWASYLLWGLNGLTVSVRGSNTCRQHINFTELKAAKGRSTVGLHIRQHVTHVTVLMLPTCNLGVLLGWLLFSDRSAATVLPGSDAANPAGTLPGLSEWAAPTGLCAGGEGQAWML